MLPFCGFVVISVCQKSGKKWFRDMRARPVEDGGAKGGYQ